MGERFCFKGDKRNMQTIINILVFFVILGAIVLIHELGHFLTAKLFGVYCAEFSIGMGPKTFF